MKIVFSKDFAHQSGIRTGCGTKFYTDDGHEIQEVVNFSIPTCGMNNVLTAIIEVAITGIDWPKESPEEKTERFKDVMNSLKKQE